MQFSTKDQDNDISYGNCASAWEGGWWFNQCYISFLNGEYRMGLTNQGGSVIWQTFKGSRYSLKIADMKIKPYYS